MQNTNQIESHTELIQVQNSLLVIDRVQITMKPLQRNLKLRQGCAHGLSIPLNLIASDLSTAFQISYLGQLLIARCFQTLGILTFCASLRIRWQWASPYLTTFPDPVAYNTRSLWNESSRVSVIVSQILITG